MTYTKQNWSDYPSGGTPISAARLNHLEQGVYDASVASGASDTSGASAITVANAAQTTANAAKSSADLLAKTVTSSTAFTPASGWSVNRQNFLKIGRMASCDVSLNRTGATITVSASGNITNTLLGTLSSEFTSALGYQGIATGPGGAVATYYISGLSLYIAAYAPSTNIVAGTEVTFAGPWMTN